MQNNCILEHSLGSENLQSKIKIKINKGQEADATSVTERNILDTEYKYICEKLLKFQQILNFEPIEIQ